MYYCLDEAENSQIKHTRLLFVLWGFYVIIFTDDNNNIYLLVLVAQDPGRYLEKTKQSYKLYKQFKTCSFYRNSYNVDYVVVTGFYACSQVDK